MSQAVDIAVDLVERHVKAVWMSDWAELRRTIAPEIKLQISHDDRTHSEWEIGNFYRHISQAWDFAPGDVHLIDDNDGVVRVKIRLTNGAEWIKEVEGEYRVVDGHIAEIRFVDTVPFRSPDALG